MCRLLLLVITAASTVVAANDCLQEESSVPAYRRINMLKEGVAAHGQIISPGLRRMPHHSCSFVPHRNSPVSASLAVLLSSLSIGFIVVACYALLKASRTGKAGGKRRRRLSGVERSPCSYLDAPPLSPPPTYNDALDAPPLSPPPTYNDAVMQPFALPPQAGKPSEEEEYDDAGKPSEEEEYDDAGRPSEEEEYDDAGKPSEEEEYDDAGRPSEEEEVETDGCYDDAGPPLLELQDGYACLLGDGCDHYACLLGRSGEAQHEYVEVLGEAQHEYVEVLGDQEPVYEVMHPADEDHYEDIDQLLERRRRRRRRQKDAQRKRRKMIIIVIALATVTILGLGLLIAIASFTATDAIPTTPAPTPTPAPTTPTPTPTPTPTAPTLPDIDMDDTIHIDEDAGAMENYLKENDQTVERQLKDLLTNHGGEELLKKEEQERNKMNEHLGKHLARRLRGQNPLPSRELENIASAYTGNYKRSVLKAASELLAGNAGLEKDLKTILDRHSDKVTLRLVTFVSTQRHFGRKHFPHFGRGRKKGTPTPTPTNDTTTPTNDTTTPTNDTFY